MAKYKVYHTLAALGLAGVVPLPARATLPASPVNYNVVMMKVQRCDRYFINNYHCDNY